MNFFFIFKVFHISNHIDFVAENFWFKLGWNRNNWNSYHHHYHTSHESTTNFVDFSMKKSNVCLSWLFLHILRIFLEISHRKMTHYFAYFQTFWLYPNQRNLRPIRNDVSNFNDVWRKISRRTKLVKLNNINIKLRYNITQICIKFVYFNACQNSNSNWYKFSPLICNLDAFWTKSSILFSF